MNKYLLFGLIVIAIISAGLVWFSTKDNMGSPQSVTDYMNATYMFDGKPVTLTNGIAEVPSAPGSASMTTTKYFGNVAKGDLNEDAIPDLAFIVTQTGGGSGTFYYVVGAVQDASGNYRGTDAVLLGDRIAPQTTEIRDGKVIVNYADRKMGDPMTAQPSEGKSIWLKLDTKDMMFGIVVQDFEGESNLPGVR
jgi:hypothetical protein